MLGHVTSGYVRLVDVSPHKARLGIVRTVQVRIGYVSSG
jgi:hypothetical protein